MQLPLFASPTRRRAARPPRVRPAAGILCYHTDSRGRTWWLLGHRTRRLGGTWANIGGSIDHGETPLAAAAREFHEELGIPAADLVGARIAAVIDDCGTEEKPYTLFVLEVPVWFSDVWMSWEHDDVAWFPTADVARLNLHPKFANAWRTLTTKKATA